jgi:beta-galactosidase GanA
MLPTAREHGAEAIRQFASPVAPALLSYLTANRAQLVPQLRTLWEANGAKTKGDWRAIFGTGAAGEEIFTAWHLARYVEKIAAEGKAAYSLPMFVNAALNRPGRVPGEYPAAAPSPAAFASAPPVGCRL